MIRFLQLAAVVLAAPASVFAQTTVTLNASRDAELWSIQGNTNYGTFPELKANSWTWGGTWGTQRALVDFDFAQIPGNAVLNSATLYLYGNVGNTSQNHNSSGGTNQSVIQRVTGSWAENAVTWNNQPAATALNQANVAQSSSPYQDYQLDVTMLVQDIINNPAGSHGFLFRLVTESDMRRMVFASSDHSDATLHPKLVVTYTVQNDNCMTFRISNEIGMDAELWSLDASGNYADYPELKANAWTWGGTEGIQRALFKFETNTLPANAVITTAKLTLYGNTGSSQYHSGNNAALLRRVTDPWTENTVTWNNQPNATMQNEVQLPESNSSYQDYVDIDVTQLFSDMYANPSNSHGFLLRLMNESIYRRMVFMSGDNGDPNKNPKLVVCFDLHDAVPGAEQNQVRLSVSPNPFANEFNIIYYVPIATTVKLELRDLYGRIVWTEARQVSQGSHTAAVMGLEAANGHYILSIVSELGSQNMKLIGLRR